MSLYNIKSSDDAYRITKFDNDLNVESSYIVTHDECDCPAGRRPTCRHRQMLPTMLHNDAHNNGLFYDFDNRQWLGPATEEVAS